MPYWFDGNNLIGQSVLSARADPKIRRAFLSSLNAYRQAGGGRFLVYFDGDDQDRKAAPVGVAIRYSAPLSADEAIIRGLREIRHPKEVIVVTNDRKLMNRCRDAGAATMDWNQFTSRIKSSAPLTRAGSDSQEPVDVDDWMQYFGWGKSDH